MANKKLRRDTITILLELLRYFNRKIIWRVGGQGRSGNGIWQQKQLNSKEPPEHLNPYSQSCVRKTFSASFIPAQPVENQTFKILHLLHQYITGETYFKSIKPYSMIGHFLIN